MGPDSVGRSNGVFASHPIPVGAKISAGSLLLLLLLLLFLLLCSSSAKLQGLRQAAQMDTWVGQRVG